MNFTKPDTTNIKAALDQYKSLRTVIINTLRHAYPEHSTVLFHWRDNQKNPSTGIVKGHGAIVGSQIGSVCVLNKAGRYRWIHYSQIVSVSIPGKAKG